jgi:hypothetical protein
MILSPGFDASASDTRSLLAQQLVDRMMTTPEWKKTVINSLNLQGEAVRKEFADLHVEATAPPSLMKLAVETLKKGYNIDASIAENSKMQSTVLRITAHGPDDQLHKLNMARIMHRPEHWRSTTTTYPDGTAEPALNLTLTNIGDEQTIYAHGLLKKWGIDSAVKTSKSLGNVKVLRVEGEENIQKLYKNMPTLMKRPAAPTPKAPAH